MRLLSGFSIDWLTARPSPGGGAATALCGAIACAQGRMVLAYSVGKKASSEARDACFKASGQLERCDRMLRDLITEDAMAYENMVAAGKAYRQDNATEDEYQLTVALAIEVPLEMAAVVSTALTIMDEVKTWANPRLLSDLGVAGVMAESAARASRYSVWVNTAQMKNTDQQSEHLQRIDAVVGHCVARRSSIESYVSDHLRQV